MKNILSRQRLGVAFAYTQDFRVNEKETNNKGIDVDDVTLKSHKRLYDVNVSEVDITFH